MAGLCGSLAWGLRQSNAIDQRIHVANGNSIMAELLESSWSIRKALGPLFESILAFSDIKAERRETARLRTRLLREFPTYCAACGQEFEENRKPEAAHILSLAEGGATTIENLVGMCKPCHILYDKGCASTAEVEKTSRAWRQGLLYDPTSNENVSQLQSTSDGISLQCLNTVMVSRSSTKASPIHRPSQAVGLEPIHSLLSNRATVKALKKLRAIRPTLPSEAQKLAATLIEAQIERRRSAAGSLARARAILCDLTPEEMAPTLLPLYYYELGFVFQMLGLHKRSFLAFENSLEAAAALNDRFSPQDMAVAAHRKYAVGTISQPHSRKSKSEVIERCSGFDNLVKQAAAFPQPWAGRWSHNILGWKWRYCYKCGTPEDARRVFREYGEFRRNHDLTNGYFRESESRICGYKAMMILIDPCESRDLKLAIKLVCRSLVSLLGFRVRPEGIRDFLMTFEAALRRLDQSRFRDEIQRLGEVRGMIIDGSSFLDPFRGGEDDSE